MTANVTPSTPVTAPAAVPFLSPPAVTTSSALPSSGTANAGPACCTPRSATETAAAIAKPRLVPGTTLLARFLSDRMIPLFSLKRAASCTRSSAQRSGLNRRAAARHEYQPLPATNAGAETGITPRIPPNAPIRRDSRHEELISASYRRRLSILLVDRQRSPMDAEVSRLRFTDRFGDINELRVACLLAVPKVVT